MFSFIIPCYNRLPALRNVLQGLCWQKSRTPFEVILVDNNSDKYSLADLHRQFRHRLNLQILQQAGLTTHVAMSSARNKGIRHAHYPWLVFLDSDIILPHHYLAELTDIVSDKQSVIITAERLFIRRADIEPLTIASLEAAERIASSSNYHQVNDRRFPHLYNLATHDHPWAFFHGCNVICRKQDVVHAGAFDEAYDGHWGYEDIDFAHRMIAKRGCTPLYEPQLYCYHQEEETVDIERFDKSANPNWERICDRIAGYRTFKTEHYRLINPAAIRIDQERNSP